MKLEISPAAEAELAIARDQYEEEREGLGQEFVDAMERLMARIVERPLQFTQVRRSHQHREPGYWKRRS